MQNDAEEGQANALRVQETGTFREQRHYVASEATNIEIEFLIIPEY